VSDHIITCPLFVMIPRKTKADKKIILNLNGFRNWHHITSNQAKVMYKDAIRSQLEGLTFAPPVKLRFRYWKPTARRSDRSNVLSIHEKFACDAMVELGCLPDDSDEFIESCKYSGGEIDRENPRVEIRVVENNSI
jgi:hypothetical protein